MAGLYSGQGDAQARDQGAQALPEDDRPAKPNYVLGASYDQLKDTKNAIAAYKKALELEPDNLDVERALAKDR